ncbi:hypothetical protein SAMN05421748_10762 [Paractinoplanes atraurantiacus]|uniref:Uncharacterized protein n=1 Tax=Paractinoplanes atraurantiacus TaxID=1036182 RepID=A0A285IBC6_9ACTN|nr:hypothetical protein SAMN05421748_10762 [Actinoplanes atraurantiacus]
MLAIKPLHLLVCLIVVVGLVAAVIVASRRR